MYPDYGSTSIGYIFRGILALFSLLYAKSRCSLFYWSLIELRVLWLVSVCTGWTAAPRRTNRERRDEGYRSILREFMLCLKYPKHMYTRACTGARFIVRTQTGDDAVDATVCRSFLYKRAAGGDSAFGVYTSSIIVLV